LDWVSKNGPMSNSVVRYMRYAWDRPPKTLALNLKGLFDGLHTVLERGLNKRSNGATYKLVGLKTKKLLRVQVEL